MSFNVEINPPTNSISKGLMFRHFIVILFVHLYVEDSRTNIRCFERSMNSWRRASRKLDSTQSKKFRLQDIRPCCWFNRVKIRLIGYIILQKSRFGDNCPY